MVWMTAFDEDKKTIMDDMTKTITSKFMDYVEHISDDIDLEDMVGYLSENDEVWNRYSDKIIENVDEFVSHNFKGWDLLSTAVDNCYRHMDEIVEDILDDMYQIIVDEYGSDNLKPSQVIPRWAYCTLREEVGISDIFKELFEKEGEIISGITTLQAVMRGRCIRWRYPLFAIYSE